MYFMEGDKQ
jgi:hypothetical protein